MDNSDKNNFLDLMNATSEYYGRPALSTVALKIYFNGLLRFTYSQVETAVSMHISCGDNGQFMPKVVDIAKYIDGQKLTTDQIIAMGRLADTPFGVMCRMQIGSWDLTYQTDMFYLKQRAQECLELADDWKLALTNGDISDNTISAMIKLGVSPCDSAYAGAGKPIAIEALRLRESEIKVGMELLRLSNEAEEKDYDESEIDLDGKKRISEMLKAILDE